MDLVVRSEEELRNAVESILTGISKGLRSARDQGVLVHAPDEVQIQGIFLIEANVARSESRQTTPETVRTSQETTPAITVTRTNVEGGTTMSETTTTPPRTQVESRTGGDKTDVSTDYEEF